MAVGAPLVIRAVAYGGDGGYIAANALPTLSAPSLLTDLDAGLDMLSGVVARPGSTRVDWSGTGSDTFTLRAGAPVTAGLSDPLLFRGVGAPAVQLSSGRRWEDVGQDFALASGSSLFLEVVLRDADGGSLAHSPGLVRARAAGAVTAWALGFGVVVSTDGGVGPGSVVLETDAEAFAPVAARALAVEQVVGVELAAAVNSPSAWLKATGRLDGGEALWQAPVTWTFDPRFSVIDLAQVFPDAPPRRDLLGLRWGDTDAGTFTTDVTARIGSATASLPVQVQVYAFEDAPDAGVPEQQPPRRCGCGAGDGLTGVAALSAALLVRLLGNRRLFGAHRAPVAGEAEAQAPRRTGGTAPSRSLASGRRRWWRRGIPSPALARRRRRRG